MVQKLSTQEFEESYYNYKDLLFRIAFTYLKTRENTEDILQEVFAKLLYESPEFASEEHKKRWLIRVTVNLCKNEVKQYWNRNCIGIEAADYEQMHLDRREETLLDEVLALPEKCKAPMILYYYEGYHVREIAEILNCGESAVKMRLKKGRELLKLELENGGMDYEIRRISNII